ncbi:type I restriction endonuclease [Listeria booriae]|uniref:type I restriction endonuclease n=1 Tax=Listeria booriae TaxID=1552123 RepID=UPI0016263C63|nr:type I restriction endonuclease [Listeria booriae]MBC1505059.1 endonuclease [Listeria booriae]
MEQDKFTANVKVLGERIAQLKESIVTEEATKTSLIMPFFQLLGYDVFNPLEFTPEFIADVGIKKGEKVDYAILADGKPILLIEAKSINEQLKKHDSQLFRYFGTTTAKFGILTNGDEYRIYTDLEEPNKMDPTRFFTFKLTDVQDTQISEIIKFHKDNFDIDAISKTASDLKYLGHIKKFIGQEIENPSEDFVKFVISEIYGGMKTKAVIDKFTPVVKRGFRQYISEQVNNKLSAALNNSVTSSVEDEEFLEELIKEDSIETTSEELEAFTTVKLLLKNSIDTSRIYFRDNRSYFNIILDDSIRKWILRLYINNSRKYITLNDDEKTTIDITEVLDIYNYADKIIPIVENYK